MGRRQKNRFHNQSRGKLRRLERTVHKAEGSDQTKAIKVPSGALVSAGVIIDCVILISDGRANLKKDTSAQNLSVSAGSRRVDAAWEHVCWYLCDSEKLLGKYRHDDRLPRLSRVND